MPLDRENIEISRVWQNLKVKRICEESEFPRESCFVKTSENKNTIVILRRVRFGFSLFRIVVPFFDGLFKLFKKTNNFDIYY